MDISSMIDIEAEGDRVMDEVLEVLATRLREVERGFMIAAALNWSAPADQPAWARSYLAERERLLEADDYLRWAAEELATIERYESDEAEMRARGAFD